MSRTTLRRTARTSGAGSVSPGLCLIAATLFLTSSGMAFAQGDPASTILQQNEQRARDAETATNPPRQDQPILTAPAVRAELPASGGQTIALRAVQFEPASVFIGQQELDAIAAPYVGRKLDFAAIAKLVRDVNDLYAKKGIVTAGAVLPPQTLAGGVLKVQLVEGRQGVVSIVGDRRTHDDYLFNRIQLTRGDNIVDVPAAAEDIAYFNRTNRAQVRLMLQPGAAFGFTDLTLGISEPPPHSVQFFLDNKGVSSTGLAQTGASYRAYGLLGMDDTLTATLSASLGSLAGTLSYELPITPSGTRVSLGYSGSLIHVVDGPTKPLNITGSSQVGSLTVSQPVIANSEWLLMALASGSYGVSDSLSGTVSLVETTTTKGSLGAALSYTGAAASFSIQPQLIYALSHDLLGSSERGVTIGTINANAQYRLTDTLSFTARGAAQYAGNQDLLPSDLLFKIGGPNTVRGYPSDGVAGDSGYFVQSELAWNVADNTNLFVLADFGEAFSTFPERTTMASVGAGYSYATSKFSLDVVVATPIRQTVDDQRSFEIYTTLTGSMF